MINMKYLLACLEPSTKIFLFILMITSLFLASSEALTFMFVSQIFSLSAGGEFPQSFCILNSLCFGTIDYLILTAINVVVLFLLGILTVWFSGEVGARISTDLAIYYFNYYETLPVNILAEKGTEENQNILLNETYRVGNSVALPFLMFIIKSIQIIALLAIAVLSEGAIFLAAGLVPLAIYAMILFFVSRRLTLIGKVFSTTFESRLKLASSCYLGIKELKVNSAFATPKSSFLHEQKLLEKNQVLYALISNLPKYFLELLLMGGLISIIYFQATQDISFDFSKILVLGVFAFRMVPILQMIYSSFSAVRGNIISLKAFVKSTNFFDESLRKVERIEKPINDYNILGGVTLSDGTDFLISVKDKYLVTGPSGIGKTSMADFLIGLRSDNLPHTFYNAMDQPPKRFSYCSQNTFIDDQFIQRLAADINHSNKQNNEDLMNLFSRFLLFEIIETKLFLKNVHFQLSGGERQRLAIMASVVRDADFFIFDEPTNNLDSNSKLALNEFLLGFQKGFILITHDEKISNVATKNLEFTDNGIQVTH